MNKRLRNAGHKVTAHELRALDHAAYRGRSDVYRYLRRNYARLIAKRLGKPDGPSWNAVAAFLSERGFENVRGEPLSGDAVRRVFRRVERDIGCVKQASPKPHAPVPPPSRQRADWQPPTPMPQQRVLSERGSQPVSEAQAAARIAELKRTFAERSGH
jgi:hypothetical protein